MWVYVDRLRNIHMRVYIKTRFEKNKIITLISQRFDRDWMNILKYNRGISGKKMMVLYIFFFKDCFYNMLQILRNFLKNKLVLYIISIVLRKKIRKFQDLF